MREPRTQPGERGAVPPPARPAPPTTGGHRAGCRFKDCTEPLYAPHERLCKHHWDYMWDAVYPREMGLRRGR